MTVFNSNTPGLPTAGYYTKGDIYIDSQGVQYECVASGQAAHAGYNISGLAQFSSPGSGGGAAGTVTGATVAVVEYGDAVYHRSSFTFTAFPLTIPNAVAANQANGAFFYTFPEGRILIHGATGTMAETTTSVLASTLTAAKTCKWGVGSTVGTNATLATTEQDIIPVTSITSSATINVAGAAASAALASAAQFDGTSTAKKAFLNFSVPTDGDLAGDATITLTGTVVIVWSFLGDY